MMQLATLGLCALPVQASRATAVPATHDDLARQQLKGLDVVRRRSPLLYGQLVVVLTQALDDVHAGFRYVVPGATLTNLTGPAG